MKHAPTYSISSVENDKYITQYTYIVHRDIITFIFIQVRLLSLELPAGYGSLPNAILANGSRDEESYLPGSSPIESKRLRFGLPGVLGVVL